MAKTSKVITGKTRFSYADLMYNAKAALTLRAAGIEPYKEPALLGITEIENQLKAKGLKVADVIGDCIQKTTSKPVLVAESHKSPAITPEKNAADDFGNA